MTALFKRYSEFLFVAAAMLLSLFLGFFQISNKSYWFDETFTVFVTRTMPLLLQTIWLKEANMWLYYLLIWIVGKISVHEIVLRGVSVLFASLSVGLIYFFSKKMFDIKVARIAAILLPINFFFVYNSQTARSYPLVLFLSLLSSYLFLGLLKKVSGKQLMIFSVVSTLAIYSHVYAGFVLVGQFLFWLIQQKTKVVRYIIRSGFIIGALLLPFLVSPSFRGDQVGWLSAPTKFAPIGIFSLLAGDFQPLFGIFGLIYLYLAYLWLKQEIPREKVNFLVLLIIVPAVISLSISFLLRPVYQSIYLFVILPYFLILTAAALSRIKSQALAGILIGLIILFSGIRLYGWYFKSPSIGIFMQNNTEEWRPLVADVVEQSQPGDAVVFYPYNMYLSFDTYLDKYSGQQLNLIETSSSYYSLGGNTKILPFPDKDALEKLNGYSRVWWVEAELGVNPELNTAQRNSFEQYLLEHFEKVQEKQYFHLKSYLYQKKETNQ